MTPKRAAETIRLDKLLWFLRFARSRSRAQAMIAAGHIRLDGRRVTRASCAVHCGQTLVLPLDERIEVIRLLSLPLRRGPPPEARACYKRLIEGEGAAQPTKQSAASCALSVR
ncbi:RNA-binding S4 domain-containing protein [Sphingopyxis sp. MWB1]|uniref:RNA-binding S4 domain-containing protein n=1 Tax=Sphingopyxis sp. MWB1 TaxID=1537715 RepID=UPI00068950A2|nr:S4 domain-containing protein [Sphingopyxis sp. MWB1]